MAPRKNHGLLCPKCFSMRTQKRGKKHKRLYCHECKRFSTIPESLAVQFPTSMPNQARYFDEPTAPKVLIFDIETLPIIGTFWDTGKQYTNHKQICEDWIVLSWSAKWLFAGDAMGDILTPEECRRRVDNVFALKPQKHYADLRILQRIWKLLDEADVWITQNGIKFDIKKLNTRFVYYGLPPVRQATHIDTLKGCNEAFDASSASLDYMTKFLELPRKMPTSYGLWNGCMMGDKESLRKMNEYGLNDTWILEDYYLRIRAYIPKHPNFSAYTSKYVDLDAGENSCPICRSPLAETSLSGKPYRTPAGYLYKSGRCGNCGGVIRAHQRTGGQSIRVLRAG